MNYHHDVLENPYRPGAGIRPPVLAGRENEQEHFRKLLRQGFTIENVLITGLRGHGKTVLLEELKHLALSEGWLWVGNDLSESSSLSEERLAIRVLTDLSNALSNILNHCPPTLPGDIDDGYHGRVDDNGAGTFEALTAAYARAPGLPSDKLKAILGRVGALLTSANLRGIVLAYDEAQCLSDRAPQSEFPLSMLVETVSSLQKRDGVSPCMLVLSGLPQIFDSLTAARSYTERMFHIMRLERLTPKDTARALIMPLRHLMPPLHCPDALIAKVVKLSGGYPYLIQFFGRELVDALMGNGGVLREDQFPNDDVIDRLDNGLFAARWNKTNDRQRAFLKMMAFGAPANANDFSTEELEVIGEEVGDLKNGQLSAMLGSLCDHGILYRSRLGRFAFTVPMSKVLITRRIRASEEEDSWKQTMSQLSAHPEAAVAKSFGPAQSVVRRWFH